nr:MAG TPA: hypothetical protein [Bacteriophage sp.]
MISFFIFLYIIFLFSCLRVKMVYEKIKISYRN